MTDATPAPTAHHAQGRRAVFVVGSGRSGSSALSCTLQLLGLHVPPPEVPADDTNPKGFGESQWVVDLHDKLLRRANVAVGDARPQAWFDTGRLSTNERHRETVRTWLEEQFSDEVREIVLKDPRLSWFIGLWRSAALRSGIEASYAVTLRPPAEVIGSKAKYYSAKVSDSSRAAAWANHMLHTERATRGARRAFVRYHDLIDDWTVPIYALGERFELACVRAASARDLRRVHDFIDPDLRRVTGRIEDLAVPKQLRAVVEETWHHLDQLAAGKDDSPELHAVFDEIRHEYVALYEEAEALTESTALAHRRKAQHQAEKQQQAEKRAARPAAQARPADPDDGAAADAARSAAAEPAEDARPRSADDEPAGARRRGLLNRRSPR